MSEDKKRVNDNAIRVEISEEGKEKAHIEKKRVEHKKEDSVKRKKREKAKKLLLELEKYKKENKELNERLLRRLADFENYKKRVQQEKEQYLREKLGVFIFDLLNVVDNFERAIQHLKEEEKKTPLAQGIQLTYKQLKDILNKYEVYEIDTSDRIFNPHFHQPLDKEEVDEELEQPMISQVYQKGYLFKGNVLRPALVKVKVKKEKGRKEEVGNEEKG